MNNNVSIRELLNSEKCLRIMEAHSPLSAMLIDSVHTIKQNGDIVKYDGLWSSSLTDSTLDGKPDIEILDLRYRLNNINKILEVADKPIILDADTGGITEHFAIHVKLMNRYGVGAVIIEDKKGLKKNSLFGLDVHQAQEDIQVFCEKIRSGKKAQITDDFMIIARVESLILEAGMQDALNRSFAYVQAGADGIMIHSRLSDGLEVIEFAEKFRKEYPLVPLVCVPTSFNKVTYTQLSDAGFNIIIYANHMLRASYKAMNQVATSILENDRTYEAEDSCLSIKAASKN